MYVAGPGAAAGPVAATEEAVAAAMQVLSNTDKLRTPLLLTS